MKVSELLGLLKDPMRVDPDWEVSIVPMGVALLKHEPIVDLVIVSLDSRLLQADQDPKVMVILRGGGQ